MSIEEIIAAVELLADGAEACATAPGEPEAERKKHERNAQALREAIDLLKTHPEAQPNEPLTLEELKQMYCQAVWVGYRDGCHGSWGLVEIDEITLPSGAFCTIREDDFGLGWKAYRRPPKED